MKLSFMSRVLKGIKRLFAPLVLSLAVLIGGHNPTPSGNNSSPDNNPKNRRPATIFWDSKIAMLPAHPSNDDSLFFPPLAPIDEITPADSLKHERKLRAQRLFGADVNTKNANDSFYYPKRYNKTFPDAYTAASEPIDSVDTRVKDLWLNLQKLKNSGTIIGSRIADFSVRAKIIYAYSNRSDTYGTWSVKEGIVRVGANVNFSDDFKLLVQVHETMHGIQQSTEGSRRDLTMSARDYQTSVLTYEAAAMTGTYLVALEMLLLENSDPGPWTEMEKLYPDACEEILDAWDDIQEQRLSRAQSLDKLGKFIFNRQLSTEQQWIDGYNAATLKYYLKALYDNKTKPNVPSKTYTKDDARRTGYISPEFNFTAGIGLKTAFERPCGNNTSMEQALDFIEMKRLAYVYGHNSKVYKTFRETLKKNNNPFMNLSLKEVWDCYLHLKEIMPLVQVMEELASGRNLMAIDMDSTSPLPQIGNNSPKYTQKYTP